MVVKAASLSCQLFILKTGTPWPFHVETKMKYKEMQHLEKSKILVGMDTIMEKGQFKKTKQQQAAVVLAHLKCLIDIFTKEPAKDDSSNK